MKIKGVMFMGRSALKDPRCYSFLLCAVSQGFSSLSVPVKLG